MIARNRESWRIEDQVNSVRNNGENPSFLLVDYGSAKEFSDEYVAVCDKLEIEYFKVFSDGLPWSRTHALNCGVKKAQTPFVIASDIDMVYEGKPFTWCLDNVTERDFIQFNAYWIPRNKNRKKSKSAGHGSQGIQFILKSAYEDIGGYDEGIKFWGSEDIDWSSRLKKAGYTQIWMPENYKTYHQWHPKENAANWKRPVTATQNTLKRLYENTFEPKINQEWGNPILKEDRPILEKLETEKPVEVVFKADEINYFGAAEKIINTQKNGFVKLMLGSRIKSLSVKILKEVVKSVLKPSSTYQPRLNTNFDSLYELLPLLKEHGLRDYFIEDDFSAVYLLWNE